MIPFRPTTIKHGGIRVTDPSRHPPQARRVLPADVVIGHDLAFRGHSTTFEELRKRRRIGQGVSAVCPGLDAG